MRWDLRSGRVRRGAAVAWAGLLGVLLGCTTATPPAEVPPLRVLAVVEPDGTLNRDLTGVEPPDVARLHRPRIPEHTPLHLLPAVVVLLATVTPSGDAEDIRVIRGAAPDLDAAAAESLARWRFRPAVRGDRAVPVRAEFRIGFQVR